MRQMVNTSAPIREELTFGQLRCAFFKRCNSCAIFYVKDPFSSIAEDRLAYAVMENGSLSKNGAIVIDPEELVYVLDRRNLGIEGEILISV